MDLINRLGGYERASKIAKCESGVVHPTQQLLDALLQYRREHNFYEAGDLIVKCGSIHQKSNSKSLWVVGAVLNTTIPCIEVSPINKSGKPMRCNCQIVVSQQFRHATPEEIQVGKRLDQNKCWSCDKPFTTEQLKLNDGFCIYCNAEVCGG
ncbi:hypothetical protein B9T31_12240 [Acinetobacter sp. ANC 4558]|uniref:hypothetical protein n=1 Tax=Acinetobacter sp. ANC 4558 TaxID=1977876 RepID=UPI000A35A339|nr:hypothetical protein [Acinetobacter sp. ANC 4558]OTG85553.1 hypothetical protein B9T31_12240 [Acinetobacter sp. ANC 4558]